LTKYSDIFLNLDFYPDDTATLKNCVSERPNFPLGKICGRLEYVPAGTDCHDGGMRTKKIYKKDSDEFPLITYVTVVRNRAALIGRCINSVLGQSYPNIEYIIVDGASTDGTLDVIEAYADKIDYYVSQPDSGIYEAMNKGVSLASGRFICMMNSDDICALDAAQIIANCYRDTGADLICGRVDMLRGNKIEYMPISPRFLVPLCAARYIDLNHQALYSSRTAFETVGTFDESYSIISDYKWELMCIGENLKFELIDDKLALFSKEGVSSTAITKLNREFCSLIREFFPFMSKSHSQAYYWGLKYGFAFREFSPLFSRFVSYLEKEKTFRIATYRAALHVCICDCWAVERLTSIDSGAKQYADKWLLNAIKTEKYSPALVTGTLMDIFESLTALLTKSLAAGDSANASKLDFDRISAIKSLCNKYYDKYRLSEGAGIVKRGIQFFRVCIKQVITRSLGLSAIFMQVSALKNKDNHQKQ
jgi:glycosyltransferase involved in cell wall biosynthesis